MSSGKPEKKEKDGVPPKDRSGHTSEDARGVLAVFGQRAVTKQKKEGEGHRGTSSIRKQ